MQVLVLVSLPVLVGERGEVHPKEERRTNVWSIHAVPKKAAVIERGDKWGRDSDRAAIGKGESSVRVDLNVDYQFLFKRIVAVVNGFDGNIDAIRGGGKEYHLHKRGVDMGDTFLLCLLFFFFMRVDILQDSGLLKNVCCQLREGVRL